MQPFQYCHMRYVTPPPVLPSRASKYMMAHGYEFRHPTNVHIRRPHYPRDRPLKSQPYYTILRLAPIRAITCANPVGPHVHNSTSTLHAYKFIVGKADQSRGWTSPQVRVCLCRTGYCVPGPGSLCTMVARRSSINIQRQFINSLTVSLENDAVIFSWFAA